MIQNGLGLEEDKVVLSPHHEAWSEAFEHEASALKVLLGVRAIGFEQVGSTAIPSIRAKPILDLLVGLGELSDGDSLAVELASLGYAFRPFAGVPEEHVFVEGTPRSHILHVVEHGGAAWRQKLAFRDALRQRSQLAREYDELKAILAVRYPENPTAYTAGKTEFVRKSCRSLYLSFAASKPGYAHLLKSMVVQQLPALRISRGRLFLEAAVCPGRYKTTDVRQARLPIGDAAGQSFA